MASKDQYMFLQRNTKPLSLSGMPTIRKRARNCIIFSTIEECCKLNIPRKPVFDIACGIWDAYRAEYICMATMLCI